MSEVAPAEIREICTNYHHDATRLLDILRAVQARYGYVSSRAIDLLGSELRIPRIEVHSTLSFYAFLSGKPSGRVVIRLCNGVIDEMAGSENVAAALCDELGIQVGQTTPDGLISLQRTSCIGMCDQAPAALINDVVVTELTTDRAREIVRELRRHADPKKLIHRLGDGNNAHQLVQAMVKNNIRREGPIIFSPINRGEALSKALAMTPAEVIRAVKTARLRGRGGAGFPCGLKWEFARAAGGDQRYVICNADEGEPGTFKDRVILTERPDRVFAGMTIAGYAIGASDGILYLRGEYAYLQRYLEHVLEKRRQDGLLGNNIFGRGFNFDIRIQLGAGAYVCGEETGLISSCEGRRGDPKNRPPFPAQKGYLGRPTIVNNVETLACVTKILEIGSAAFCEYGTQGSTGTKLLSISGDCTRPGVYEVPFGLTVTEMLEMVGGQDAIAVQVGGASGQMIGPQEFNRKICFDDLATGGSIMIFGPQRNLLHIVERFLDFFIEESCGYCTPCRVGNVLLRERIHRILDGRGEPEDLSYLQELAETVKLASRCGLGQTSPNPVLSSLKNFRPMYTAAVKESSNGLRRSFNLASAVRLAETITGRKSTAEHV